MQYVQLSNIRREFRWCGSPAFQNNAREVYFTLSRVQQVLENETWQTIVDTPEYATVKLNDRQHINVETLELRELPVVDETTVMPEEGTWLPFYGWLLTRTAADLGASDTNAVVFDLIGAKIEAILNANNLWQL